MDEIKFPWPKVPRLSKQEERRLGLIIKASRDHPDDPEKVVAAAKAVNDLTTANFRLVWQWARKYRHSSEVTIPLEDLFQEGCLGLLRVAKRFNPDDGRFSTYASYWIKQAIQRAIGDDHLIPIAINRRESRKRIWQVRLGLIESLSREPTDEEWAHELGFTDESELFHVLDALSPTIFLEDVFSDYEEGESRDWMETIVDLFAAKPELEAERFDLRQLLEKHLAALVDQEQIVLVRHFGFNDGVVWTLAEIGLALGGLSRERVRQIEKNALKKLRQRLEGEIDV